MFTEEFLKKYPMTRASLCLGLKLKAMRSMDELDITPGLKEALASMVMEDKQFLQVLEENPGTLFRHFDSIGVYFYVYPERIDSNVMFFYANINDSKKKKPIVRFSDRKEAEKWAIMEAFEMAEALLSKEVKI